MKQRSPWISISDLLSGVVLILLLLFVMATMMPSYSEEAKKHQMMEQIEAALKYYEDKGQIKIHIDTGILEFTSVTFASGSALLTNDAMKAVSELSKELKNYMDANESMEILIEGHTDPAAIRQVMNKGGYFSDNIGLSTLRAANVRAAILKDLGSGYSARIGVAGYGETRLKNTKNPLAPENRRIEIRILWNGKKEGN